MKAVAGRNGHRAAEIASRSPLRLIKSEANQKTISTLEEMLIAAKAGEITGMAFVVTLPGMRFISNATGYCADNPSFARGAVMFLSDQLGGLAHEAHELDPSGIK